MLIVCEGVQTEPNCFRSFRAAGVRVEGAGDHTYRVVNRAVELRDEGDYDRAWCVFDRDSFLPEHFNRALQLANARGLEVAYSNESFELWYLLHFEYLNSGIGRDDYVQKLHQHLGAATKRA